jgi:prephenate dehydratase
MNANPVVAFQGELGAYSHQAVLQHFGADTEVLPCRTFPQIFDAVHHGQATHGMLPVENSLAGTVIAAYDALIEHDLRLQAEVIFRVSHCLMGPPGLELADAARARSHPQALAQCAGTLRRLGLEPVSYYDTAGSARDLAQEPAPGTLAVASRLAADIYGLAVLMESVEDEAFNFTRFFVLGTTDPERRDPSKTSIIFTTRHVPGALYHVLRELAERGINLTKIESRPRRNRPWHYRFFVDFEGHLDDPPVQAALLAILQQSSFLKVLGSYPAAAPVPASPRS